MTDLQPASVHLGGGELPRGEQLSFGRRQLALSVGRTQTLSRALLALSQDERLSMMLATLLWAHIDRFVEQGSVEFSFTEALN
jgi:hypothetical protein